MTNHILYKTSVIYVAVTNYECMAKQLEKSHPTSL